MSAAPDCPLCGSTAENDTDLRVHLMVDHRKSDLAALVSDRITSPGERRSGSERSEVPTGDSLPSAREQEGPPRP